VFNTLLILYISFPLSFYGTNVVREKVQNLLKQFRLYEISNNSYWLSVLISNFIIFIIIYMLILLTFIICKFTPFFQISMISLLFIFIYLYGIDCLLFQYCVLATSLIMKIMFFLSFSSSAMIHHMLLLSELFLKISKLIYRRSTPNPNLSWSNCIPKL